MATTNYHTVNGEIIGETTSSVRTGYLTDGLGSVTATQGSTGNVLATYRYKPYGTLLAKTGAGSDPRFLWTGTSGSRRAIASYAEQYNRKRHYCTLTAQWSCIDPIWPFTEPFAYARCSPVTHTDPSGLFVAVKKTICGIPGALQVDGFAGDAKGIASGLRMPGLVIDAAGACSYCESQFEDYRGRILILNGSLFDLTTGKPLGDTLDCQGASFANSVDRARGEKFEFGLGYIWPRHLFRDGSCWEKNVPDPTNPRPRTIIQFSSAGPVFFLIPAPGLDAKGMCRCFGQGSGGSFQFRVLHLDGGKSTQSWIRTGTSLTSLIFSGRRLINNWIWIRERSLPKSELVEEPI